MGEAKMKVILATIVILISAADQPCRAYSLEPRNASFYCRVEFSGGISINEISKRWDSVHFVPVQRFTLKLQFISSDVRKDGQGNDESVTNFKATIIRDDPSHMPASWFPSGCETNITVKLDDPWFSCSSGVSSYNINLGLYRFLSSYMAGYVDGSETNDAKPSMSGGTCYPIE
ncbi:hypothetical protein V1277_006966 [Bradyrhizobium sp. AZCC 1588]|uniref:hypothetical protein n=1 Tax=unclassified Bradyrhizobium TaxID=2631580 RepID=UPI002FF317AF